MASIYLHPKLQLIRLEWCRQYSVNTHATNPNPPGTEPGQSRIKRRGGACMSGSADSQYPQNNRKLMSPPPTPIRPSLLLLRKIPPEIGTTTEAHPRVF